MDTYACVYIHIYIWVCIYIFTHTYICIYIHTYIHTIHTIHTYISVAFFMHWSDPELIIIEIWGQIIKNLYSATFFAVWIGTLKPWIVFLFVTFSTPRQTNTLTLANLSVSWWIWGLWVSPIPSGVPLPSERSKHLRGLISWHPRSQEVRVQTEPLDLWVLFYPQLAFLILQGQTKTFSASLLLQLSTKNQN